MQRKPTDSELLQRNTIVSNTHKWRKLVSHPRKEQNTPVIIREKHGIIWIRQGRLRGQNHESHGTEQPTEYNTPSDEDENPWRNSFQCFFHKAPHGFFFKNHASQYADADSITDEQLAAWKTNKYIVFGTI